MQQDSNSVKLVIEPRIHDIGQLEVRRLLPVRQCRSVGPFVFFDQMGPANLKPDAPVAVRPHPHIGLATLTWLFDGAIMHRDSLGYQQEIKPGEINWMTAGSGIVHSERSPQGTPKAGDKLFGLQIWMALPKEFEETEPSFQHYSAEQIPLYQKPGVQASIIAGELWGLRSPVQVYSTTIYADIRMQSDATLRIEENHLERALYLLDGELDIDGVIFKPGHMLILNEGQTIDLQAATDCHFVWIGGEKLDGKRYMWWNFVSSRQERIEQAKADWKAGRFDPVNGDENEFIPLPEG